MRYICLLAILLALPESVAAQVAIRAGRNSGSATTSTERTAVPRSNDGANDRQGARQNDRAAERQNPPQNVRQDDRRSDRQNDRGNGRSNDRQTDRSGDHSSGLGPLGLPPARATQLPWWEQRQVPAWEQKQTPWWERQQQQQLFLQQNPARVMLDQQRDARRLAKTPRPRHHKLPPAVYVLPPYGYFNYGTTLSYGVASTTAYVTPEPPMIVEAPPLPPDVVTGFLRLEVEPRDALQVFVDGLYVGTPADLGDEFELRLGARRIELRAPGYRTLIFDTQIVPDRMIVYRGALEPMSVAPAPQAPRAPEAPQGTQAPKAPEMSPRSRTMYLIPGCYMGNVEPTAAMLRPGCDISKLTTIVPQ